MSIFDFIPPKLLVNKSARRRLRWKAAWDTYYGYWVENPLLPWMSAQYGYPTPNPEEDHLKKRSALGGWYGFFANQIAIASIDRWDALYIPLLCFGWEELIWFYDWLAPSSGFGIGISGVLGMQAGYLIYQVLRGRGNWLAVVGGFSTLIGYIHMFVTDSKLGTARIGHGAHLGGIVQGAAYGALLDSIRKPSKGVPMFSKHAGLWTILIVLGVFGLQYLMKKYLPDPVPVQPLDLDRPAWMRRLPSDKVRRV